MSIVIAILIFAAIILFHEFGHFIVAKKCDVKVNEFCLGFGPKIVGFKKGETEYILRLLPLGGACVMEGEEEDTDDDRSFQKKPLWQKALIVAAGPLFNFLLAYILSVIMIGVMGFDAPQVSKVMPDYPAEEAGLQAGDEIKAVGNYRVYFFNEVSLYLYFHSSQDIKVTYVRDGKEYQTVMTPQYDEESGRYLFGIYGPVGYKKVNVLGALGYGAAEVRYQIYTAMESVKFLFTGRVKLKDMAGPVGIVKSIGDTYTESVSSGALYVVMNLFGMTILLSANLGVMNLIPIPALDGGRLLFFLIEAITRKKIPQKVEAYVNFAGFAALMALMLVIMVSDIYKIVA